MARLNPCPVSPCEEEREGENLMCAAHWERVPENLKRDLRGARAHLADLRRRYGDFPGPVEADRILNATQDRQHVETTCIGEVELQDFEAKQRERKKAAA